MITLDFLFFLNLVSVFLISVSCFKIAYKWKNRKRLSMDFYILGTFYIFVFFFMSYWNYTNDLFMLVNSTIFLILWTMMLSRALSKIIPSKKAWLNYIILIYALIPFIHFLTESIEITFINIFTLSGSIIFFIFLNLMISGKNPIKIASMFGVFGGLLSVFYTFSVLLHMKFVMLSSLLLNVFLSISFISFWYISSKHPEYFLPDYDPEKDGMF